MEDTPTLSPVPVLFEDNHLLVVEKPVNVPTQEDESGDPDLLRMMKQYIKIKYGKPGDVFLGLVHRLDRPVGGAIVFARTSKAASRLSEAIRTHDLDKHYLAVVHGVPSKPEGRLVHYLAKDRRRNVVTAYSYPAKDAKEAVLHYRVLDRRESCSLVHIQLKTGRSHQIRVQFAATGCPLFGDQKYGNSQTRPGQQLALWSVKLAFSHPTKKTPMSFVSLPPRTYPWNLWTEAQLEKWVREEEH